MAPPAEHRLGGGYQGAVFLRQTAAGPLIIKKATGSWLLRGIRQAMLRREHAIYVRLAGVRGVPATHGLDAYGNLLLEYVPGPSLREAQPGNDEHARFFTELRELIERVHAAGVAHGDLKRKDNILVGPDGRPWLIDFGTAIALDGAGGWLRRALWRQVCRIDLNAWFKLKYQRREADVEPADLRFFRPTPAERIARPVLRGWRTLTLRRWRRRRS